MITDHRIFVRRNVHCLRKFVLYLSISVGFINLYNNSSREIIFLGIHHQSSVCYWVFSTAFFFKRPRFSGWDVARLCVHKWAQAPNFLNVILFWTPTAFFLSSLVDFHVLFSMCRCFLWIYLCFLFYFNDGNVLVDNPPQMMERSSCLCDKKHNIVSF